MSVDPVVRLAALQIDDPEEALNVRFPAEERLALEEIGLGSDPWRLVEEAASGFSEQVEEAVLLEKGEVILSVEVAELIAIALKTRKRPANRPKLSKDQQVRRNALAALGRQLKSQHMKMGMKAGVAEVQAAKAVAEIGRDFGEKVSWQTFRKWIKLRPKK
ncbi:hypothetical protein GRI44_04575 [Altererythrobacter confluentis]|uniref:Uncharacterized protein n=1 Tax=Allopontixanthobacter confluentis TaxID=1849021 RepID=A0A6L7GD87_9SPHN|nr:hypothetical protein [Allopontixanthobacter confluentis]MXP14022.1 hypothetical protein [Allopontixanthobacter confluentis]